MKREIEMSSSELYAVERAAHAARAKEVARLILAGANALGRLARLAVATPVNGKGASHA